MTKEKKERAGLASKLSLPIAHWDTIYFILNEANTRWRRGNMRYHGGKKNILRWKGPLPSQEALSKSKIINLVSQGFLLSQYCSSTTSKCIRKTQAPKSTHYQKHSVSFTFTCKRLCVPATTAMEEKKCIHLGLCWALWAPVQQVKWNSYMLG